MGVLKNVKKAAAGKMAKMAQGMAGDKESAAPKNEKLDQLNEIYQEQEEQLGSPVKDDDTILALDIGTEYVKAVIARQDKKGGLDVIGIGRAHQAASNMYAGAIADIPGIHNQTSATLDYSYVTALGLLRVALDTLAGTPEDDGIRSKLARLLQN